MKITAEFDSIYEVQEFITAFGHKAVALSTTHDHVTITQSHPSPEAIANKMVETAAIQVLTEAQAASAKSATEAANLQAKKVKPEAKKPEDSGNAGTQAGAASSDKKPEATTGLESPFEEAKNLIHVVMKVKSRGVVEQILKEGFGAARLGDVANEKLPDLVKALKAALPPAAE